MFGSSPSGLGVVLGPWVAGGVSGVGLGRWYLRENENSGLCLYVFYLCGIPTRFLESNWFVWVTQMNHIPMHIDHDRNRDWVSTQVRDGHLEDLGMTQLRKRVSGQRLRAGGGGGGSNNNKSSQQHGLSSYHVAKGVTRDSPSPPQTALLGEGWTGLGICTQSHALPVTFSSSSRQHATSTNPPSMTGSVDISISRSSTST